ncbi:MAG: FG-GAP-like repeat-containing protein, partial [bacterium]
MFEDDDQNGVRDKGEMGLPNVTLFVSSGDSAVTDAGGYYNFSLQPGVYSIKERDEPGYSSSTVNTYVGIMITPDTTVTRNFGDFLINQNDYIEITIGNTERALSVAGTDLKEDPNGDLDIVMGTPFTANGGNMLVFHNSRRNATTALGALFSSTPTYTRDAGHNVNTLTPYDFSGDGSPDVLTGIHYNTGENIQVWFDDKKGVLGTAPANQYVSTANTYVMDATLADLNNDSAKDLIVGLRTSAGTYTGAFQTFKRLGSGEYTPLQYIAAAGPNGEYPLGEVWSVDTGDIDLDGDQDVVVGTRTSDYYGFIDVFINTGVASSALKWGARYFGLGAVNALEVIDMMEDDAGDPDLLVGTSASENHGFVILWHNTGGVFGRADDSG